MFQKLRQKGGGGGGKGKKRRLLTEESGLSFGKAFILRPSPERTHTQKVISQSSSLMKVILPWYPGGEGEEGLREKK